MTSTEDGVGSPPAARASNTLESEQPLFQALFEYWKEVRGSAIIPQASEVDPASIPQLFKHIAIFDLNGPEEIIYRLAGTGIEERTGIDPTGMNLFDLVPAHRRTFTSETMWRIATHPVGMLLEYENILRNGKRAEMRSLYLPLRVGTSEKMRIISIHVIEKTVGFEEERTNPEFAAVINQLTWIDIGAGTPLDKI
ncbi:MAG: PAS domain-containing protein [Parvibaculum sp.]